MTNVFCDYQIYLVLIFNNSIFWNIGTFFMKVMLCVDFCIFEYPIIVITKALFLTCLNTVNKTYTLLSYLSNNIVYLTLITG